MVTLKVFDTIKYGFKTALQHFQIFFFANVVMWGLYFIANIFVLLIVSLLFVAVLGFKFFAFFQDTTLLPDPMLLLKMPAGVPSFVVGIVIIILLSGLMLLLSGLMLGFTKIAFQVHDTGQSQIKELFSVMHLAPRSLLTTMLHMLLVGVGVVLFVVPGIIFLVRFALFPMVILQEDAGVIQSLRRSFQITRGNTLAVCGIWFSFIVLGLAGFLLFDYGIFPHLFRFPSFNFMIAFTLVYAGYHVVMTSACFVAFVRVYRTLTKAKASSEKVVYHGG